MDVPEERPASAAEAERRDRDRAARIAELRTYLAKYLELRPDQSAESLRFERACDLPGDHGEQYRFLGDARLADTEIVIVPDDMWVKGSQPSESHAGRRAILMREGYYHDPKIERQDESAWMTHELAHLQQSLDRGLDEYEKEQSAGYPDNQVERHAFSRQFEYLRSKGAGRSHVAALLENDYSGEELVFLSRILDEVYASEQ